MKYFATLPKVVYTDKTGVSKVMTNLMARASVKSTLLNDSPIVFLLESSHDIHLNEISIINIIMYLFI